MQVKIHLQDLLKKRKISLYRLSKDTGISYNQLTAISKNETKRMDFSTLATLCEYLGCNIADLLSLQKKVIKA
jgi:putative transcriptional regulator